MRRGYLFTGRAPHRIIGIYFFGRNFLVLAGYGFIHGGTGLSAVPVARGGRRRKGERGAHKIALALPRRHIRSCRRGAAAIPLAKFNCGGIRTPLMIEHLIIKKHSIVD